MNNEPRELESIKPGNSRKRRRLTLKGEFALASMPTLVILTVLALVEVLSRQRLLFASLASSAFLIYLDPQHGTNTVRTLVISQILAASIGLFTYLALGPGYLSAGSAMILTIVLMILLDVVHPPAVATSLSFALKAGNENNLVLFGLAVGIIATLVLLERCALWLLTHYSRD
ncbi:HPP family protein [Nostoc sp. UCD121]|jgi:CBS-domain-containing membrane protein|uniref:HPP family protein n=1 Tax=unclassified Nostoc TaxID=2593658 RepID=UPI001627CC36|nr:MULTISPECIES: HPP family protein [unclassified Nostoc]MBC1225329.1 HPP family protein [Nostoc sp. UCD120]MBC1280252.1 HPP family protein [Nostoc sp. UCD121]MBC1297686.1 HPP family protein [Nostoc sp. UCD122]